ASAPGQFDKFPANRYPIPFKQNETYGTTPAGFEVWSPDEFTVQDTLVWHVHDAGFLPRGAKKLHIDGLVVRGDPRQIDGQRYLPTGLRNKYYPTAHRLSRLDIQGCFEGIRTQTSTGERGEGPTFEAN